MRFYEGEEGLKTVYYDCLNADELLVICKGSPKTQISLKDDPKYLKDFIEESMFRKLKTREILEDTPATREYKKKYGSKVNEIRIVPRSEKYNFGHVDKHVYEDKIAYISHDNLVGVIIQDKTLSDHERSQFDISWKYHS